MPREASHIPIGVHHGGYEFGAKFGRVGRDFERPLFVDVGDADADVDVVAFPTVVFDTHGEGVGAFGLEVEVRALGH